MSLTARKSDLKNHLSRSVKKHYLNLGSTTDLPNDTAVVREGGSADGNNSIAIIDLGSRASSEAPDPHKAAV
jgi:hypothetical protein